MNQLSVNILVYTQNEGKVYTCTFRSDTEWKFVSTVDNFVYEVIVNEQGWTENAISIASGGDNVILTPNNIESLTLTYDEAKKLALEGHLFYLFNCDANPSMQLSLIPATRVGDKDKTIYFGGMYMSSSEDFRYVADTDVIKYSTNLNRWFHEGHSDRRLQSEIFANKGLELLNDNVTLNVNADSSLMFDASNRLKLNYTTIEVEE